MEKKIVEGNFTTKKQYWIKSLLRGVPIAFEGDTELKEGDWIKLTIPGLDTRRIVRVDSLMVTSRNTVIHFLADLKLKSGNTYSYSSKEWLQEGKMGKIDYKELFRCFGITEFYVGSYDNNAIKHTTTGPIKYVREFYTHINCSQMEFRVRTIPEGEEISSDLIIICRDAGAMSAATRKPLFPSDDCGGLLHFGFYYNEYRRTLFGNVPNPENSNTTMIRAMAEVLKKGSSLPLPGVTSQERINALDMRLVMAKVNNVKSDFLWEYHNHIGVQIDEIKSSIEHANLEELIAASCMHWRHEKLMTMISESFILAATKEKAKPKFILEITGGTIMIHEGSTVQEMRPQLLVDILRTMETQPSVFFAMKNWKSYVSFCQWIKDTGVCFCHLRFFIYSFSNTSWHNSVD